MTVLEALNIEVNNKALAEKYLFLQGLSVDSVFSSENANSVEIAKAYCFKALVNQPDWSEDGLSVKYNREQMIKEANSIFTANNLADDIISINPEIKNKSLW